ncbi:glycoside hydrolase family 15 protein [Herbidospora yilanensis]|uniref:glycoside hydrolase family 15 protein n=1 Tax=Herbidospora yilanensis TaxID=354426 RepID=UPI000783CD51|nr:glycoside hydrolase family 15 protein [Herbidospora yilanensis]
MKNGGHREFTPQTLRQYAFLADGYRGALIGPMGDIGWLCMPRWDSDAVFASLLGGAGLYAVTPADRRFVWGGFYESGSLIWHSRWVTSTGILDCREALALPATPDRAVLLRRISTLDGPARVTAILDPRAGYGREPVRDLHQDASGSWTGRTGDLHFRWTGADDLLIHPGHCHDLVLELSCRPFDTAPVDAETAWRTTEQWWRSGRPSFADRDNMLAHAVLRGMNTPGGGLVAAATTSLPERADAGRNYDYRYAWIRDQCYAGHAAAAAGDGPLLDAATGFITARLLTDGPGLVPAYTAAGGRVPDEQPLPFLPGYPGAPVKVGNHVNDQFQLDVFGETLVLLAAAARLDRLDSDAWRAVETAADAIALRWREPDSGIWELDRRRWVHSQLACAAGLKAAAAVAPARQAAKWRDLAHGILTHTTLYGLHPSGRWQRAFDDSRVDASLLIPAVRGVLPPEDPRVVATRAAVHADLERDGHVYRFRQDRRPLGEAEGAFVLCGFVAALAAHRSGDRVQATRLFERSRGTCGPPGLYSEEYDITEGQSRGNLPQAFVHALALEAAATLST